MRYHRREVLVSSGGLGASEPVIAITTAKARRLLISSGFVFLNTMQVLA
jgi:hypothetical protein